VKVCVNCGKEVPDSALHCVFCGARQPGPRAVQQTLLGHGDLAEEISRRQAAASAQGDDSDNGAPRGEADSGPAPAHSDGLGDAAGPDSAPAGEALDDDDIAAEDTAFAMTQAAGDIHAVAEERGGGASPAGTQAGHDLEDAVSRAIEIADEGGAPRAASAPPATRPPTKTPAAPTPVHTPSAAGSNPMPALPEDANADPYSATQPLSRDEFNSVREQALDLETAPAVASSAASISVDADVDPTAQTVEGEIPAELPPFLASETHTRHNAPIEPFARRLRNQLMAFGGLLAVGLVLPWETGSRGTLFAWHELAEPGGAALFAGAVIATAIAALVLGVVRLPVAARGIGALACGAVPIAALSIGVLRGPATAGIEMGSPAATFCSTLGLLLLACGLLVRSQYRAAITGRALATAGALLTLVALLMPAGEDASVVASFAERFAEAGGRAKPAVVMSVAPFALAVLGLLAWMPTGVSFGAGVLAWVVILWLPLAQLLSVLGAATPGTVSSLYHGPVALTAWYALAAYGVATVAGKQLEYE